MGIEVAIRGESGAYVSFDIAGYSHPTLTDYWDGNWLLSRVTVHVVGFTADLAPELRTEDFVRFLAALEEVAERELGRSARFDTMEGQVEFKLGMAEQGTCTVDGRIRDHIPGGDLQFSLKSDQSYLAETIQQLNSLVHQYPVRGQP